MLLQLRPALNIQRADHKGHSWMSPHHTQPCLGQRKGDTGVILQSGILQYICSLLTEGSSQASPRIPQRRHKHFPPKKSIFVRYCRWILYKFALSPKYHPFWIAPQQEHSPLLSDWGRPPTLIRQQEKLFLSQLRCCASVCENISALPLFLWRANEMKLLSSVNCFRLWLAVVGGEIAFLSPSPLLSLSRSLFFFLFSPTIQPLLFG